MFIIENVLLNMSCKLLPLKAVVTIHNIFQNGLHNRRSLIPTIMFIFCKDVSII